jgi:serine/threonine protein phosphatase PrpC
MTESSTVPTVPPEKGRLVVQVALRTDVGRVRSENQDFGIVSSPEEEKRAGEQLMMVADGMGGHRGGATASRLAATTVKSEFYSSSGDDVTASLKHAFEQANLKILGEAVANPDLRGMGTTGSALVVWNNQAYFAHVGDSRIYFVREGSIRQLTDDHSLVASMVREGLLTAKEAETHPRRNVLQRSIGVGEDLEIDVSELFAVQKDDVFILCSDGLHGLVKENEMLDVAKLPISEAASEFVRRALDRGAPDNVTVIVARVVPAVETTRSSAELRDTAKIRAITDSAAGGPAASASAGRERARAPLLKWLSIAVLILAAAGALAFWRVQTVAQISSTRQTTR